MTITAKYIYQSSYLSTFQQLKDLNGNWFKNLLFHLRTAFRSLSQIQMPSMGLQKTWQVKRRSRTLPFASCITKKFSFPSAPAGHYIFCSPRHDLGALVACQAIAMNVSHCLQNECVTVCGCECAYVQVGHLCFPFFIFFFCWRLFFNAFCCTCHELKLNLSQTSDNVIGRNLWFVKLFNMKYWIGINEYWIEAVWIIKIII